MSFSLWMRVYAYVYLNMLVCLLLGESIFAISEKHKTFLNEHLWRRIKLVLFFSYILLVNPHLRNSYKKNSMLLHGTSIVVNNDTFLKGLQRRLVTRVFFTRDMCRAVINEQRTVEKNEKREKLGNYSHLCDAKECNVVYARALERKLWEELQIACWISFYCTERKYNIRKDAIIFLPRYSKGFLFLGLSLIIFE